MLPSSINNVKLWEATSSHNGWIGFITIFFKFRKNVFEKNIFNYENIKNNYENVKLDNAL
jgi:hypothetical protein